MVPCIKQHNIFSHILVWRTLNRFMSCSAWFFFQVTWNIGLQWTLHIGYYCRLNDTYFHVKMLQDAFSQLFLMIGHSGRPTLWSNSHSSLLDYSLSVHSKRVLEVAQNFHNVQVCTQQTWNLLSAEKYEREHWLGALQLQYQAVMQSVKMTSLVQL